MAVQVRPGKWRLEDGELETMRNTLCERIQEP